MSENKPKQDNIQQPSGNQVRVNIGGDVESSQVVATGGDLLIEGGLHALGRRSAEPNAFTVIYQAIEARPVDPKVDKAEISETIKKIENEVERGVEASTDKLERWFSFLAQMAPDIFEVAASALAGPQVAAATVIRKVIERARIAAGKPASSGSVV